MGNIRDRRLEAAQFVKVVELSEDTDDPAIWGRNFPRQYDAYKRTVDIERTRYGGSEAFQHLDEDPVWRELFKGYAFGTDYREERGHGYMLVDQRQTERVSKFKQPGACLQCHASIVGAYRRKGLEAGAPAGKENLEAQVQKGFEVVCAMPYPEATKLAQHPVSCVDCHDPETLGLRVTRPGFLNGIRALAAAEDPVPHLPSIEAWRRGSRAAPYDPNRDASRQEMRSFVCGQCHVEYYFKGEGKLVTYPWHKGLKVEQIEAYYDEVDHKDWTHPTSGAKVLKAQHPEFEMWSQGIHARNGVACADCHMPYKREGALKVSDHHVRSPMLNISRACLVCHHQSEAEMLSRVQTIQTRTDKLMTRAEGAILELIQAIDEAAKAGIGDDLLSGPRHLHRQAQWRLDFVAENSMGFHADQESARILAEAIDYGRLGIAETLRVRLAAR
jgi:nitrite reductase (cytochrome c-552)